MNDNTRRQWDEYQERNVPCSDCAWLLMYLVADHTAATGVTRPGWQRLKDRCRRSRSWVAVHLQHLERDGHIVLVTDGRWHGRQAAEYEIPWLHNPPAAVRKQTTTRTTTRTTPSPLRGEQRSTPRNGVPAAALPQTGDETDPDWCRVCEEVVPWGTPCRCPGGGCEELRHCRVGSRHRLQLVGS